VLPADVQMYLRLNQPISSEESAAGDPITARLDKAVKAGDIHLPSGWAGG
jgi:hypothetical protein